MSKTLVIVESPGKIKKIQSILGNNFIVSASVGHIIDLNKKKMSIDIENNFTPEYAILPDKTGVIKDLKINVLKCGNVLLATDEDREGEMIAWSLEYILKLKNPKRIIFNSITKDELLKAIKTPTVINQNMVHAQKTRRIMDRLMGYELTPLLNKNMNGYKYLSAGRVQSVVVKLIIDKENEINNFISTQYYVIKSDFQHNTTLNIITATLYGEHTKNTNKNKISDKKTVYDIVSKCKISKFKIRSVIDKESIRNPQPPFTTSTMQQTASKQLNMNIKNTMFAAQKLYEHGYITYMRTDSTSLSADAMSQIQNYIVSNYGDDYYKEKIYINKKGNTQEAHEAIRPTNISCLKVDEKLSAHEAKLYSLIWKRTVASQMSPALYAITEIEIIGDKLKNYYYLANFEQLKFNGYLAVYNTESTNGSNNDSSNNDSNNTNTVFKIGDMMNIIKLNANEEYKKPPSRYNEASLINMLDPSNLNIGRPSTYATIITKILDRDYVEVKDIIGSEKEYTSIIWSKSDNNVMEQINKFDYGAEKNKFVPTLLGMNINKFLVNNFSEIMDYQFTANLEIQLDNIAEGKVNWINVLHEFYNKFHPLIIKNSTITIINKDERMIGTDENGYTYIATTAKYGPVVKKTIDNIKYTYAPIKEPLTLKSINLQDAIQLMEYPKELGKYKNKNVILKKGQYGIYITWGKSNIPLSEIKEYNLDECINAIDIYWSESKKNTFKNEKYVFTILNGQYGNYIKATPINKKLKSFNITIPSDLIIENINLETIHQLIDDKFKNKNTYVKKSASAKKSIPAKDPVKKSIPTKNPVKKSIKKTTK
jgi:DNA topoisomerase-1